MRKQYPEKQSHHKLKIDNYRTKLIRKNDENEKPLNPHQSNLGAQIDIKLPKEQKKNQLKPEGEKQKTRVRFHPQNIRIGKQKIIEPLQNEKNLRKPNMRFRKSFSTQLPNILVKREKDAQNDIKRSIHQHLNKYSGDQIQFILIQLERQSVLSHIKSSTFLISKDDLTIFIKGLVFFQQHHRKKQGSKNQLFAEKTQSALDLKQFFQLFQTGPQAQLLNKAEVLQKDSQEFQEKRKNRTMEYYNKKITQINETIKQLKEMETNLTNKILSTSNNEVSIQYLKIEQKEQAYQYSFGIEYKQIEEDLKNYALTLQTQKVKRGVKSEFTPFSNIESSFESELVTLTKLVNYDDSLTPAMKVDLILNFLRRTMQKLKQWGQQVQENVSHKVACITEFIVKIKNWYNQVHFKEEFLFNIKTDILNGRKQIEQQFQTLLKQSQSGSRTNTSLLKELQNWIGKMFQLEEQIFSFY